MALTFEIHWLHRRHNLTSTGSLNWSAAADTSDAGETGSYKANKINSRGLPQREGIVTRGWRVGKSADISAKYFLNQPSVVSKKFTPHPSHSNPREHPSGLTREPTPNPLHRHNFANPSGHNKWELHEKNSFVLLFFRLLSFKILSKKRFSTPRMKQNTIKDLFYMKVGFFLKSMFKHLRSFTLHLLYLFMN